MLFSQCLEFFLTNRFYPCFHSPKQHISYRVKAIQGKYTTQRTARAEAIVRADRGAILSSKQGNTEKGPVAETARIAGIMAAKKTSDLIPYCHPIPLDHITVDIVYEEDVIVITSSVTSVAKTGVEMEALVAANIAALTVYDMLKPITKDIEIVGIRLLEKHGGKSDMAVIPSGRRAGIVIVSDRCSSGTCKDETGPIIYEALKNVGVRILAPIIVPDETEEIVKALRRYCDDGIDLIITSGGTGVGPRDVTAEATKAVIERELPGIAESLRSHGQASTPYAMLSRGTAGQCKKSIIVNLPGSLNAVKSGMTLLLPAVFHAFDMMENKPHR